MNFHELYSVLKGNFDQDKVINFTNSFEYSDFDSSNGSGLMDFGARQIFSLLSKIELSDDQTILPSLAVTPAKQKGKGLSQ